MFHIFFAKGSFINSFLFNLTLKNSNIKIIYILFTNLFQLNAVGDDCDYHDE